MAKVAPLTSGMRYTLYASYQTLLPLYDDFMMIL